MFKTSSSIPVALRSVSVLVHLVFLVVFVGYNFDSFGQFLSHVSTPRVSVQVARAEQHSIKKHTPVQPHKGGIRLNKRFHPESFLVNETDCEIGKPPVCTRSFAVAPVRGVLSTTFLPFGLRAPPEVA